MPAPPPRRLPYLACCVAALGLLFAAYSDHFDNGFHFDDSHVIVSNPYVRSVGHIKRFFTDAHTFSTRPESASYRPLLTLSYALDYWRGGGLEPRAFHSTQFALLVLLGALLGALYRRLCDAVEAAAANRWIALVAATLFCVHTANTQTVNYLCSRSSLVATLGAAGSVLVYVGWPRGRGTLAYLAPLLVGGLAKPLTVMVGPLLLLYRLLFEERLVPGDLMRAAGWRRAGSALRATLPAFVAGGGLFAFTAWMTPASVVYADADRWRYLLTQPAAWLHYVRLFVLPLGLTADTDWTLVDGPADARLWIGLAFVAALGLAFVRLASYPRLRPAAFGLGWFAIALLPTSSVFPLSEAYNEHRIFFPYVGLTLVAVWLAVELLRRVTTRRAAAVVATLVALAVLGAHALGTHARNRVWRDDLSLWEDVTVKSPGNGRGLMNYGVALMGRGQLRQARRYFERAERLLPGYGILQVNLAVVKDALGEHGVEGHFLRALELDPGYARGRYHYARWLAGQGRGPEALEQLAASLAASAGDLQVRGLYARLLAARGDEARLAAVVRGTLAIAADDTIALAYARGGEPLRAAAETAAAYSALARRRGAADDWLDAAGAARRAAALAPDSAQAWNDLGWARLKLGFPRRAAECFERSLELDPDAGRARANLQLARQQQRAD